MEDEMLKSMVGMLLSILFLSWVLRHFRQPYFIAYIIAGILLGPGGIAMFKDVELIAQVGSLGLIMQMFFT
jgi:monovalent cation:H+ antiporter-2, CPA2 family